MISGTKVQSEPSATFKSCWRFSAAARCRAWHSTPCEYNRPNTLLVFVGELELLVLLVPAATAESLLLPTTTATVVSCAGTAADDETCAGSDDKLGEDDTGEETHGECSCEGERLPPCPRRQI